MSVTFISGQSFRCLQKIFPPIWIFLAQDDSSSTKYFQSNMSSPLTYSHFPPVLLPFLWELLQQLPVFRSTYLVCVPVCLYLSDLNLGAFCYSNLFPFSINPTVPHFIKVRFTSSFWSIHAIPCLFVTTELIQRQPHGNYWEEIIFLCFWHIWY